MSRFTRLFGTTALAITLAPQLATAQVTADDVWQNQKDYIATLGGEFTSSAARSGDTLTVSDMKLGYDLPFGTGSLALSFSEFSMTENGDGTVSITYANPIIYGIAVDITDQGSFSGSIDFTVEGSAVTASGTRDDVTYVWSVDRMDMKSRDLALRPSELAEDGMEMPEIDFEGSFLDMSGTTRVRVGALVRADSSFTFGRQDMTFGMVSEQGRFSYKAGAQSTTTSSQISLPRNGIAITNLAAAVREGLAIRATSKTIDYQTSQITEEYGQVVTSQSSRAQEQSGRFELDSEGLRVWGSALDAEVEMQPGAVIPFLIRMQIEKAEGGLTLPLSTSAELQDVAYDFSLQGMTLNEEIWALFDPQQTLPRDPMSVRMDLSAKVRNKLDWLDFAAVQSEVEGGEVPVELHAATLNNLTISMAGAQLVASGAGTFDNSDLESYDGFPKPTGVIDLTLKGGNGLLDNLVAIGLLSEEDATGARLAAAVVAKPDPEAGEDALKSRLELTEDGQFLANGQRLR